MPMPEVCRPVERDVLRCARPPRLEELLLRREDFRAFLVWAVERLLLPVVRRRVAIEKMGKK